MKGELTKERILDAAEELMLANSFHSVGINQILTAIKVTKGSFYHHFASKEQFGVELLRHYADAAVADRSAVLLSEKEEDDPLLRLFAFFEGMIQLVESSGYQCPCLMHKLANEVYDFSDAMRQELAKGFQRVIGVYAGVLKEAEEKGRLPRREDREAEAAFILDLWQGALQRALLENDVAPLRNALSFIRAKLSASQP
ncbi:MAG: TetR family transcriptional regulator C-terminal domain-containing protein [Verrucomicrobiota bacterium JB023]|nr:TetR family transcriptional regulator C-terminal domain-containing protein [Verrucomicrobiota bacterium JB023]